MRSAASSFCLWVVVRAKGINAPTGKIWGKYGALLYPPIDPLPIPPPYGGPPYVTRLMCERESWGHGMGRAA